MKDRTWMEIDLNQIRENYRAIQKSLPEGVKLMAVLKADAYGMGACRIGQVLQEEGCDCYAVTFPEEEEILRNAGITGTILVTSPYMPGTAIHAHTIYTADSLESAKEASSAAVEQAQEIPLHIKLDVGLGRLGIAAMNEDVLPEALEMIRQIRSLKNVKVTGLYTHITAARGEEGDRLNRKQLELFQKIGRTLREELPDLVTHCLSTFPLSKYPEYAGTYARVGALLFGASGKGSALYGAYEVESCVSLKTTICSLKTLPAGSTVSYGPTYTASSDVKAAVVPVGFADGLSRNLSNNWSMLLHGKEVPIIGKITCDYTILDVSGVPDVKIGDVVTVFGKDGESVKYPGACAACAGMSVSEMTSVLHTRISRVYL